MAKDKRTATKIHGHKVTLELEDWLTILGVFKLEVLRARGEAFAIERAAGGNGCDGACGGHGGCDFEAGEEPERVFVCEDGHVILEGEAAT
jgi:hypothetical protein